ncbi:hypothetical protein AVEN_214751-1 [Araneus ventricosus]|uniref:Uncharacterized protein n=1 Tax=Araneus ventricosus TaxID=182803 RepID=A0A4Y2QM89_ARAVE|nr:hypothetical protein AVEN_214751-1 [Araneus ventricosus]
MGYPSGRKTYLNRNIQNNSTIAYIVHPTTKLMCPTSFSSLLEHSMPETGHQFQWLKAQPHVHHSSNLSSKASLMGPDVVPLRMPPYWYQTTSGIAHVLILIFVILVVIWWLKLHIDNAYAENEAPNRTDWWKNFEELARRQYVEETNVTSM